MAALSSFFVVVIFSDINILQCGEPCSLIDAIDNITKVNWDQIRERSISWFNWDKFRTIYSTTILIEKMDSKELTCIKTVLYPCLVKGSWPSLRNMTWKKKANFHKEMKSLTVLLAHQNLIVRKQRDCDRKRGVTW